MYKTKQLIGILCKNPFWYEINVKKTISSLQNVRIQAGNQKKLGWRIIIISGKKTKKIGWKGFQNTTALNA